VSKVTWRSALGSIRRVLWLLILVGAVVLVGWLRFWRPVPASVARVERGPVVQEVLGRGTVESQREAAVGFDLVGRLSNVMVDEGTRVSLGQELAQLETVQAQADLSSAQTSIDAARSALRRLAAEEERAQANLAAAVREAGRTQHLAESGVVAGAELDAANDRLRIARADLDRVLAQRAEATRGVAVASGGAEQRRAAMVRTTLLAPFDGLITRRLREPGDTVAIGTTVLRVVDTDRVYIDAAIDETVLPQLSLDQPALILFPGTANDVVAKVSKISWEADRQTHELRVEVTAPKLERRVAIGQRADVRIEIARRDNVLRVPTRLLHHDAVGPFLYVDRDGRIAQVRPRLGLRGNEYVELLDGLPEGATMLAAPGAGTSLPLGRRWRAQ